MQYINERYNRHGGIDCEIEHPVFGWIPTTLTADDTETAELFAIALAGVVAPYVAPALTLEELKLAVRDRLHSVAVAHGFDNISTACEYAAAINKYQAISIKFIEWRGAVWEYSEAEETKLLAGTRALPASVEDFILELPVFTG